jgi:hypothetical protein
MAENRDAGQEPITVKSVILIIIPMFLFMLVSMAWYLSVIAARWASVLLFIGALWYWDPWMAKVGAACFVYALVNHAFIAAFSRRPA